jgi:hypothetical protein
VTPPDPAEGPVADFAHELGKLKRRAGDPSFATICTRLGAALSKYRVINTCGRTFSGLLERQQRDSRGLHDSSSDQCPLVIGRTKTQFSGLAAR